MRRLTALFILLGLTVPAPAGASATCGPAADRNPALPGASLKAARSATLCLLNRQRRRHRLRRLRFNHQLAVAGLHHAEDMVDRHYFSHDTPGGKGFVDRILGTDYVPPAAAWTLGENLAWGDDQHSTPRQIVRAWMRSRSHRRNILARRFREIGIAIVVGAPVPGVAGPAATYATEFGVIRRA